MKDKVHFGPRTGQPKYVEIDPGLTKLLNDALARADEADARVKEWEEKARNWMASPEAQQQQLDGYRELASKLAASEALADRLGEAVRDGLGMLEIFLMTQDSHPTEAVVAMLGMGPKVEAKLLAALAEWRAARGGKK